MPRQCKSAPAPAMRLLTLLLALRATHAQNGSWDLQATDYTASNSLLVESGYAFVGVNGTNLSVTALPTSVANGTYNGSAIAIVDASALQLASNGSQWVFSMPASSLTLLLDPNASIVSVSQIANGTALLGVPAATLHSQSAPLPISNFSALEYIFNVSTSAPGSEEGEAQAKAQARETVREPVRDRSGGA